MLAINPIQNLSPEERLIAISEAKIEARTLQEILKVNFDLLLSSIAPDMAKPNLDDSGFLAKMSLSGSSLHDHVGLRGLRNFAAHKSNTARGLAAFGLAHGLKGAGINKILTEIRTFAADSHFGVREWAWLAVRLLLVRNLDASIKALSEWTRETDFRLRRFAVEVLRPRAVWCNHIPKLRKTPRLCLPLLEPMRAETEKYAQDSVANWLNDASKDNPNWVLELRENWRSAEAGNKITKRIIARATRSIKPKTK